MTILTSSAFLIGVSETLIWLTMRHVIALGSPVSIGGSDLAGVPAPAWLWIMPLSIVALIIGMQASGALADSRGTPSLMLLAWSALFLSLGLNLAAFGIHAPGGGYSLGLLVSSLAVSVTGGGGLYSFREARKAKREMERWQAERMGAHPTHAGWRAYQAANAVAVAVGIAAGWGIFALLGH
jgi:hypothetical protein